ncbi:MAG: adenylate/guanylate cyclase domain-containing protein [Pseudomonadota bacterium]
MRRVARWFGAGRSVGLALVALLLALRIADPAPVAALRHASFDLFQQIAPRAPPGLPVAIVDIDDPSLAELGQWPWPRTMVADLIDRATADGAAAIALDIVFAEPDRLSPDRLAADNTGLPAPARAALAGLDSNDAVLARAVAASRVVLGETSVRSARAALPDTREPKPVPHAFLGPDPAPFLQDFPDLVQNLPALQEAASGFGVFTVRPDRDGIYRRVPLVLRVQGALRLGLSAELLRVATGGQAFAVRSNAAGIDGVVVGGQVVRTEADGTVWPHFSPHDPARFVSAADLIEGRMPAGRLAGHLVLVGTTAIGLEDFRPTPLGVPMAGVEIHAQVLENILSQSLLVRPNYAIGAELATLAILGLLVVVLVPAIAARWVIALAAGLVASWAALTWGLFETRRILLDPSWPILGTALVLVLMSTANYLREERRRAAIRTAFGQYVSPDLVARLADAPEALTLGGERRDITVLFSDVRGFTALAEGYRDDPQGLTALMNRLLNVLSAAILDHRGTIDKFMGDAVMAFWNAPLDIDDHPQASCAAALRMQADIARLNGARLSEAPAARGDGGRPIDVGIGINTGSCVVGNMGSDTRFDYTALGDAVNLASRLEGQCKTYGVKILLGAATAETVAQDFALIEIDLIRVKGKTAPERIYALLGDAAMQRSAGFAELAALNAEMRQAYAAQKWAAVRPALDRIDQCADVLGVDLAGYTALYRGRCAAFLSTPPGPGWDGVTTAAEK